MPRKQITYSSHPNHRTRAVHAQGERQFKTYDTSHIRPRKSVAPVFFGILLAVVVLGLIYTLFTTFLGGGQIPNPFAKPDLDEAGATVVVEEEITATIPDGATAASAADVLKAVGVIDDTKIFLQRAQDLGLDGSFKAGTYTFTAGMTLDDVINALAKGVMGTKTLTIPEGWTVAQIADAAAEATGKFTAEEFLEQAKASNYVDDYKYLADAPNDSMEGFLFPKTYELAGVETPDDLIRMMLNQFITETNDLHISAAKELGLNWYQVVTLASIIEKEALPTEDNPDERELVSSVFYNRLRDGMYLQSDATMGYVTGGEVKASDLETDSPYNTYLYAGVPPTPICCPSIESLTAACYPAETDYYYFFIVEEEGYSDHAFSTNGDEHQAAIDAYNAYRAEQE